MGKPQARAGDGMGLPLLNALDCVQRETAERNTRPSESWDRGGSALQWSMHVRRSSAGTSQGS